MKSSQRWKSAAVLVALAGGPVMAGLVGVEVPLAPRAAHAQSGIAVLLNGRVLNLGATGATQVNGRVLVPLRGVFEALGAAVDYDAGTQTVFATRPGTQMQLRIGSTQANVNGVTRFLDVPAQTRFGRTLVPLRFVSEALGAVVTWNAAQRAVYITANEGGYVDPNNPPIGQPPVTQPPVTPPVDNRQTISGVVVGAVVSTNAFVIRTDDNDQFTVRTIANLPRTLSTYDRVTVAGTRNGDNFNAETLTIDTDMRPARGDGEVIDVRRNQFTIRFSDGRTFTVIPNARQRQLTVGDQVRVIGFVEGNTIRYADVTIRENVGGTPPPIASGVNVDFSGVIQTVNRATDTLTVRGDNGQLYTVSYNRIGVLARNQRVRVQGTFLDGVTTARTITVLDN